MRVFAVVGPSGAGKDTLMEAAARRPGVALVRRVVTRAPEAGGEDCDCVTPAEFARRRKAGDFALDWDAHGLSYGIPRALPDAPVVLMNLSRGVLADAARVFPGLAVLHVTARPEILAARLSARCREDAAAIAGRIARAAPFDAGGLPVTTIDNSGALGHAEAAFTQAIGIAP